MTKQQEQTAAEPRHPAVVAFHQTRTDDVQLRLADAITTFAGSMPFVYIHALTTELHHRIIDETPRPN